MTRKALRMFAQGDTAYQEVEGRLADFDLDSTPRDTIVLAEGERSGHAHVARGIGGGLYHDLDVAKKIPHGLYIGTLVVTEHPLAVTHEEHAPLTLPPNSFWVVRRQRELSTAAEHEGFRLALD